METLRQAPPPPLVARFDALCATPSNINEHLVFLRDLASQVLHIVEFGTRNGRSATAFLMAQPALLDCYDLVRHPEVDWLERNAGDTVFQFHQEDTREASVGSPDLLFIDSTHTYDHLLAELTRHAASVSRWIAIHDTISCGDSGPLREDPRFPGVDLHQHRPRRAAREVRGIMPAIVDFLAASPDWHVQEHRAYNNGLMLLRRI